MYKKTEGVISRMYALGIYTTPILLFFTYRLVAERFSCGY
jgi:hypothetical protein